MSKQIGQNITYLMKSNGCLTAVRRVMLSGLFTCMFLLGLAFVGAHTLETLNKKDSSPPGNNHYKTHQAISFSPFSKCSVCFQPILNPFVVLKVGEH